jgi:hypothetical protein
LRLGKREKYLISAAGCALALILFLELLVFPFYEKKDRLEAGVRVKEKALKELRFMSAEYALRKQKTLELKRIVSARKEGFALFSYLENAAGQVRIKIHIKYMKPSDTEGSGPFRESAVEMKLTDVTLKQLVDYLHAVESPQNAIYVKRMSIKESKGASECLDGILQVVTFTPS